MRLAYIAGPIDEFPEDSSGRKIWREWRIDLCDFLHGAGFDTYHPDQAFGIGSEVSAGVQTANNAVIDVANLGLVLLPSGVPTLGTPVEVERMLARKIPVVIATNISARSVQLADWKRRGAVVCGSGSAVEALTDACRSVQLTQTRPNALEAVRQLGTALRRMSETASGRRPLVFEPVDTERTEGWGQLLPTRGYADDAGLDLFVAHSVRIEPGHFVDVPTGVKVDIPPGHWAMITGRSSTLRKHDLLVTTGVIDAGWTGELFAGVKNVGPSPVSLSAGDRVAQLILLPAPVTGMEPEWGRVPMKDRGTNGFGSTGS